MNHKGDVNWWLVTIIAACLALLVFAGIFFNPLKTWNKVTNDCEQTGISACISETACMEDTGVIMREKGCENGMVCCMTNDAGTGGGGSGTTSLSAGSVSFVLTVDGEVKTSKYFQMTAGVDHFISVTVNGDEENLDNRICSVTFLAPSGTNGALRMISGTRIAFPCDRGLNNQRFRLSSDYVRYSPLDFDFVAFPTMTQDYNASHALDDSAKFKVTLNPTTA